MDAVEHLPGCNLRHRARRQCSSWHAAAAETSEVSISGEYTGASSTPPAGRGLATGCVWFVLGAFVLTLGGCLSAVGYITYSEGVFDRAPGLPQFARPKDASLILSRHASCYMTDDFGPYEREMLFGTNESAEAVRKKLIASLAENGWTIHLVTKNGFFARAPYRDLRVHYDFNEAALLEDKALSFKTQVRVTVSDCEV